MNLIKLSAFVVILAALRLQISRIPPTSLLEDCPNTKFFLIILTFHLIYNILKHNGLLPKKNISGQHVFITGGAMGIGKQFALRFSEQNCKVTIADLNTEAGEKVVEEIKKYNKNIQLFKCDVTKVDVIAEVAKKAEAEFGPVDILINNAGVVTGKKLLENTERGIELTYNVNSIAHAYTVRQFLPGMIKRNKGHIVTIASIAGHLGVAGLSDYCGSKYAAVGFDESIRMELTNQKSNVKTTCICPYFIDTGMFDGISPSLLMRILLPLLSEVYVGKRVLNAVRQEEEMVLLPAFLYVLTFLKSILPVSLSDLLQNIVGTNNMMDNFKGRQKQQS